MTNPITVECTNCEIGYELETLVKNKCYYDRKDFDGTEGEWIIVCPNCKKTNGLKLIMEK